MKIYIVDDEPRQRRGMEQLIRNLYPEADILSFNNGLLAIQSMDKQPADIIFSDIRMPHMMGLELAERIHHEYPNTIIILISAYAEFEYAQKAISLHVFEYLVKPVQPENVKAVLLRAIEHLHSLDSAAVHHSKDSDIDPMKSWAQLMQHNEEQITANHVLQIMGTETDGRYIYMDVHDTLAYAPDDLKEVFENLRYWFEKLMHSQSMICASTSSCSIRIDAFLYQRYLSMKAIRQFQLTAHNDYHLKLNILVSRFYNQLGEHWNEAKRDISELKMLLFYHSPGAVLVYEECPPISSKSLFCSISQFDLLMKAICAHDEQQAVEMGNMILNGFANENISPDSLKEASSHLLMKLFESLFSADCSDSNALDRTLSDIRNANSFAGVKSAVAEAICSLSDMLEKSKNEAKPVQKVIRFIEENYDKRITVSDAAELCHYSVSHFSAIFKNQTGKNFVTYLNNVRLHHVLHLISATDWDINEIAHRTGFGDINYLNRLFKRAYGMTVQNYRETLRKGEKNP